MTTKVREIKKKIIITRRSKTLEELKKEQGVKPFDFNNAGKNWPEDADFEEFKAAINSGRKHPREW